MSTVEQPLRKITMDKIENFSCITSDELAESLKASFEAPIKNDEWRPLAKYIIDLVETEKEKARYSNIPTA